MAMSRLVVELAPKTKKLFKTATAAEGHSMVYVLRRFIEEYVRRFQSGKREDAASEPS